MNGFLIQMQIFILFSHGHNARLHNFLEENCNFTSGWTWVKHTVALFIPLNMILVVWSRTLATQELRGVKDWVYMKTAKKVQDFNCFCNLDVNHKLLFIFIIKVVYLCT